jgi:nucleotide-binding universal stress UspA family protein
MIKELLVTTDGSLESVMALRVGAAFSQRVGVPLTAVMVTSPGQSDWEDKFWIDDHCKALGIGEHGTVVVPSLDVAGSILEVAERVPGTAICMMSHGRTGIGEALLASESAEVVRRSSSPVLLVGPHAGPPVSFETLEVCVDGSPMADRVVSAATEWSSRLGSVPWLVQVVDIDPRQSPDEDLVEGGYLHRAARPMSAAGLDPQWEVLHGGDASRRLVERASELGAGLIVMGTHGRSGLRRVALGSVAAGVVHRAACPVLLVGPNNQV